MKYICTLLQASNNSRLFLTWTQAPTIMWLQTWSQWVEDEAEVGTIMSGEIRLQMSLHANYQI